MGNASQVYDQVVGQLPKGTYIKKSGNFVGNSTVAIGSAFNWVRDKINYVPLIGGFLSAAVGVTGATIKTVGSLANLDIKEAAHTAIKDGTVAVIRGQESWLGVHYLDGFTGASKKAGNFLSDKIVGKSIDKKDLPKYLVNQAPVNIAGTGGMPPREEQRQKTPGMDKPNEIT